VRSRVARFAAVVLLAAGCTAGDRAWGNNLFGVAAGPGQPGIAVAVYSCPGMTLQSAALQELNSRGDIQTTLWQIHRVSPGPDPAELIPGIVPAGFAQDVVLRQPTRDGWVGVQLTQGGYLNGLDFHLSQLDATSLLVDQAWFSGHHHVSRQAFTTANQKNCIPGHT
jgi:hypothetical protein